MLALVAGIGFGWRFRAHREDFDRWLALAATLALFAQLHYVFTPLRPAAQVSLGDFLRLLSYGLLLVGVWNAIGRAEFGRAVAEERARVAREIHDGLAQYLFAVSTHASMLENGADPATALPRLREAAALAQQEARFAVLALSSASGNAPFDAALRRYVDFLTADGELDVEKLEFDENVRLAPRRADRRSSPRHRPGRARQRRAAMRGTPGAPSWRSRRRSAAGGSSPCATTARASTRRGPSPVRACATSAPARRRSAARSACARTPGAARRWRSYSARNLPGEWSRSAASSSSPRP